MIPTHIFAFGDASSSVVNFHVLLTTFQTGPLAILADVVELAIVVLYVLGVRRMKGRGRIWSRASLASFLLGVFLVWFAVGAGLAAYDEVNVTMHVIQHILLMMVAPPLIALGKPVTLASQALSRTGQVRVIKVLHNPVVAVITFPVITWFLYFGTMYAYFMTPIYPYSIAHPLFHDLTHLWFLLIGILYWHPLVGLDASRWRLSYPVRLGSLFVGMPFEAFLGIGIAGMPHPLAPINTLVNTHTAGDTFWVLSMVATVLSMVAITLQWFRQLERTTKREDRRAEIAQAKSRARAEELGIKDLPEGFTIPWWRLNELEAQRGVTGQAPGDPNS